MCFHFSNALVARPLGQKEINNTPAAQTALEKEWNNLTSKGAWDYSTVREWEDVSREAIKNKTKVHVGKIFEICVEKEVSSRWVTLCASLRVAPCFRETTSRTRQPMSPCSRSLEVHWPTWRQEKHWMLMAPCRGTGHRRAMESKHTPKH